MAAPLRIQFSHDRHIEFRIVLLHVPSPVFLPKLLDHGFHGFGIKHRSSLELRPHTSRINP